MTNMEISQWNTSWLSAEIKYRLSKTAVSVYQEAFKISLGLFEVLGLNRAMYMGNRRS